MSDAPRFSHYRNMYENKYLGAWDLFTADGRKLEPTVVIATVTAQEIVGEKGRKERKLVLTFLNTKKNLPMICSKRNGKAVASLYGTNTADWIGKPVTLFVERVAAFGDMVEAISIRGKSGRSSALRDRIATPAAPTEPAFDEKE